MAKQPSEKPEPRDRHQSGFLIRLPESFREPFKQLKRKTGQPYTVAAARALVAYLKANGIPAPDGFT